GRAFRLRARAAGTFAGRCGTLPVVADACRDAPPREGRGGGAPPSDPRAPAAVREAGRRAERIAAPDPR
ncbi:hypothetical protein, partial [Mizugakiibacter sediminis]|uniref:hypothetical protein n=1 Tax=Mizugakiibacter sediminis TaxID=1475481 RepID=UPI001F3E394F